MKIPKCSRCKQQVGKDFIYLDKENLLLHPRCKKHHERDKKMKDIYKIRNKYISNPLKGGLPQ